MGAQIDPSLLEVLREIPPLLPKYLPRRRVGVPVAGELASELGVERPLIFLLLHVDTTQSMYGRDEVTFAELRAHNPYQVIDDVSGPLAKLKEKGLVDESTVGRFTLSPEAHAAVDRLHTEATRFVARRVVLPTEDARRLADELRRAASALEADPRFAPFPGSHLAGFQAKSRYGDQSAPMVRIEQAVGELWGARDDAYTKAWREADMEGPPLDVLAHIWSGANTVGALCEALRAKQSPDDVESSLSWLVEREYVQREGDSVSLTPQGAMMREDIEHETDRVYFEPWPYTVEEAVWVRDELGRLVDGLATPSPS
jgi:hypothetical protein